MAEKILRQGRDLEEPIQLLEKQVTLVEEPDEEVQKTKS